MTWCVGSFLKTCIWIVSCPTLVSVLLLVRTASYALGGQLELVLDIFLPNYFTIKWTVYLLPKGLGYDTFCLLLSLRLRLFPDTVSLLLIFILTVPFFLKTWTVLLFSHLILWLWSLLLLIDTARRNRHWPNWVKALKNNVLRSGRSWNSIASIFW